MDAAGTVGDAPALLSPSSLRLCFVTRSQGLALEPLEVQLLRESGQGDTEALTPSPILRPSILAGTYVRVRIEGTHRLDRVAGTEPTADGRIAVRLQGAGRSVPLTSLSRGSPLEGPAAWQRQGQEELAALQAGLAERPPTCREVAAASCRLSAAWRWAQHPSVFAAALQRGLPCCAAQLEDAAAVEWVLPLVEPAAPTPPPELSAAAAAEQFLAAVAAQTAAPAAAAEPAAAAVVLGVRTPAQPVLLPAVAPADLAGAARMAPPAAAAAAAAAAGGGGSAFFWEAADGSGQWEAPPEQYRRVVTLVPDGGAQQLARQQKRGRAERSGSGAPAKRHRSEAPPAAAASPAVPPLGGSLSGCKQRQIEEDVPPGSRREALLMRAVTKSCPAGQERQGGDLGNALEALDRDWKARLGDHSLTDLLLAMGGRGLVWAEVQADPSSKGSGRNVYYSRARPPPPPPAAEHADSKQLACDVPRGSTQEALLVRAVAELDAQQPGQLLSAAALGNRLHTLDSGWKARLGGHRVSDLVWALHRRGLVRAEVVTTAAGLRNLHLTNLRC